MSSNGADSDLALQTRAALLDALTALADHRESVIVIGAQAIYLHTGEASVAVAAYTKDSDLALDSRTLGQDPRIEDAMRRAGFTNGDQPGSWIDPRGVPVDLMVPDAIAGPGGRRGARIPPHNRRATRRAAGLEAAVIDRAQMAIASLSPHDPRVITANVAGPTALLVAKLHKLGERQATPERLMNKDAHDVYRLLVAVPRDQFTDTLRILLADGLASNVTTQALDYLNLLFAAGPNALGSSMAGRTELGLGDPDVVAASCTALANDILTALFH